MNRVLLVGTLGAAEPTGTADGGTFVRSRLADPTGSVTVTGGGFQPRALEQLRSFAAPGPAMVVGKTHLFRGRDGTAYTSVRAETLRPITVEAHRTLLAEVIEQSWQRADLVRRLAAQPPPTDDELGALGLPLRWIEGARQARRLYPTVDPASLLGPLRGALRTIDVRSTASVAPSGSPPSLGGPRRPSPSAGTESVFLEVLDEIAERSIDGFASLDDLIAGAGRRGIRDEEAEELLGRLEESGAVEEPVVGKVRRS